MLNGRTFIQGDRMRELRAHAFQWDGKVYYDVQVANSFSRSVYSHTFGYRIYAS